MDIVLKYGELKDKSQNEESEINQQGLIKINDR